MRLEEGAEVREEEEGLPGARKPEGAGEGALEEGSGGRWSDRRGLSRQRAGKGRGRGEGRASDCAGAWLGGEKVYGKGRRRASDGKEATGMGRRVHAGTWGSSPSSERVGV